MNKKLSYGIVGILCALYFFLSMFFYSFYSNTLDNTIQQEITNTNNIQEIVHLIHTQDSLLYQSLVSKELLISKKEENQESNLLFSNPLTQLLSLQEKKVFSSQSLTSTIDDYYQLESLRNEIISLYKQKLISDDGSVDDDISKKIRQYNLQTKKIVEELQKQNQEYLLKNTQSISELKNNYLLSQLVLFAIFIVTLFFIFFSFQIISFSKSFGKNTDKEETTQIFDKTEQEILEFIQNQISKGNFPTINEIKKTLKLSHPTILSKLNHLEEIKKISITKKGRNKHVFLR
jgi:uncharacterized membrane protein